jgi:hypothetical protein
LYDLVSPAVAAGDPTFRDQELDEVLDARPKPVTTGWNVHRLNRSRRMMTGRSKELRKQATFGMYMDVRTRHAARIADILHSDDWLLSAGIHELER